MPDDAAGVGSAPAAAATAAEVFCADETVVLASGFAGCESLAVALAPVAPPAADALIAASLAAGVPRALTFGLVVPPAAGADGEAALAGTAALPLPDGFAPGAACGDNKLVAGKLSRNSDPKRVGLAATAACKVLRKSCALSSVPLETAGETVTEVKDAVADWGTAV